MIGKNIYKIRKIRGYSLSELAERASISKSYLSNIERNLNKNPSLEVMKKLASVLGVDMRTLLKTENLDNTQLLEKEWFEFVSELKAMGIEKEDIQEYKSVIEFLKWQKEQVNTKN